MISAADMLTGIKAATQAVPSKAMG